jgi:glutaredoxin 3
VSTAAQRPTDRPYIEIFSAGCLICREAIDQLTQVAREAQHDVRVLDMQDAKVAQRAKDLGIRSLPAVVMGGSRLAACCSGGGPDAQVLREELARYKG